MATFRIDQATPGPGTAGRSRHDLIPGEIITLVATAPTGPGITYAWEILDKAGSAAVLSSTTGISVSIGLAGAITQPCAFLIKLTVNDNGNVTEDVRIASVRTLNAALRLPLFPETAPTTNRLNSNNPDLSTDNAQYANRAGLGASGQNWRGWSEWAFELVLAVEAGMGGGGPPTGPATGDLSGTYPAPVVDGIQGRTVVATAPTNGQVYAWNTGLSQWEPVTLSSAPSGPATGDLSGTYPGPLVDGIQGVPVSPTAPTNGQALVYNSGTLQWEPTAVGGTTSLFVYEEGGVAGDNVYATWTSLYAAASAVAGVKIVRVSDASGTPEISAGAYDLHDWTFVGNTDPTTGGRPNLMIRTGVTITGNFRAERMVITLDAGATTPITYAGSSTRIFEFVDTMIDGGVATNGMFTATASGAGLRFILRGNSRMLSTAVLLNSTGAARIEAHDQSQVDSDAVSGSAGTFTLVLIDPDTVTYLTTTFTGTFNLLNPVEVFNGPLDAQQTGTTELHIGSVYLTAGTRILGVSPAMLGATVVTDEGFLRMRQFTGGSIIQNWTQAGLLASVPTIDGDISITTSDWYDLYLYAGGVSETAVIKGLRLLVVRDSMPA